MKLIGRKIYIAWGDNQVVALEKLSMNPEDLGMKKCSDVKPGDRNPEDYIRLADVVEILDEVKTVNHRLPMNPSLHGRTLEDFFVNTGNWIDEKDAERLNAGKGHAN